MDVLKIISFKGIKWSYYNKCMAYGKFIGLPSMGEGSLNLRVIYKSGRKVRVMAKDR